MHYRENWMDKPPPALTAAGEVFTAFAGRSVTGDRLALWLRTTPEGRRLEPALAAYAEAKQRGALPADCQIAAAIAWIERRDGRAPTVQTAAIWLLGAQGRGRDRNKEAAALTAALAAAEAVPLEAPEAAADA